jgi:hypothetical protein
MARAPTTLRHPVRRRIRVRPSPAGVGPVAQRGRGRFHSPHREPSPPLSNRFGPRFGPDPPSEFAGSFPDGLLIFAGCGTGSGLAVLPVCPALHVLGLLGAVWPRMLDRVVTGSGCRESKKSCQSSCQGRAPSVSAGIENNTQMIMPLPQRTPGQGFLSPQGRCAV